MVRAGAVLATAVTLVVSLASQRAVAQDRSLKSVTFAENIAPILQRSCQQCHHPNGAGPMSLVTYQEVRPWARAIKTRTSRGPRAGVMPPWYIEKDIGIQRYKDDPSLSDAEIETIGRWADTGAPAGDLTDMPKPLEFGSDGAWRIGVPDLIVQLPELSVKANAPDWWGDIAPVPIKGLTEPRYVSAVEIREVNDVPSDGARDRLTVGGRFVVHHMSWTTTTSDSPDGPAADADGVTNWPIHEVGRNADLFDPRAGRLLRPGSSVNIEAYHLHSNGRDTKAHIEIGFKFHPRDYKPEYRNARVTLGNGLDISIWPNQAGQQLHAYAVLQEPTKIVSFEPHLHAPGARMCLEAIWGINIQTLTCAGYDHNWVRSYTYQDDAAPLLPRGTILHIVGYMDTTSANRNVADTRNWSGSGNRSISNMFIDFGVKLALTDEQFEREVAERRRTLALQPNDVVIGCPLCNVSRTSNYLPAPPKRSPGSGAR